MYVKFCYFISDECPIMIHGDASVYSSLVEIRSPRVRKGTLVILWFGRAGGRACARVPLRSCDLMFGFDFVWIMDQGSWIKYQGSSILDLGPWTWHEWPSWTGYRLEIKTIRIYYQRSIILYRFYKDTIKYQVSWTLFWHERSFLSRSGHDIKTTGYYNSSPISFYRF